MAAVAALLFLSSALAREVGRRPRQRRCVSVGGITLFLFGGVTESKWLAHPSGGFSIVGHLCARHMG